MAGFEDLLDPLYTPPTNQTAEPHVIGTSLNILVTVLDGANNPINFTSGYTAIVTPHVQRRQTALAAFTHALTGGRQVVLGNGTIAMTATPAASTTTFGPYAELNAVMTLIVTRTSDGKAATIWRECILPIRPKLNV